MTTLLCGVGGRRLLTGEGLEVKVDTKLNDLKELDIIIVPGLGITDPTHMEEFLSSKTAHKAIAFLNSRQRSGAIITASCSATFLLAEAGLLEGLTTTTTWWLSDIFRMRYPDIDLQTEHMLISGPGLICAGAAMAQVDLMMVVVAQL